MYVDQYIVVEEPEKVKEIVNTNITKKKANVRNLTRRSTAIEVLAKRNRKKRKRKYDYIRNEAKKHKQVNISEADTINNEYTCVFSLSKVDYELNTGVLYLLVYILYKLLTELARG